MSIPHPSYHPQTILYMDWINDLKEKVTIQCKGSLKTTQVGRADRFCSEGILLNRVAPEFFELSISAGQDAFAEKEFGLKIKGLKYPSCSLSNSPEMIEKLLAAGVDYKLLLRWGIYVYRDTAHIWHINDGLVSPDRGFEAVSTFLEIAAGIKEL